MNKKNLLYITILTVIFFVQSKDVFSAELIFQTVNNTLNDGSALVEVKIDPKGKEINSVEGILKIKDVDSFKYLSVVSETGGSVFTLWPNPPVYSSIDHVIRFAGGTQKGFSEESLLFRIRLNTDRSENFILSMIGGTAYLNDGLGTKEPVFSKSLSVSVPYVNKRPDSVNKLMYDNNPPLFSKVEIGKDDSIYEGKYFVTFYAQDDLSGVDRYEITEDDTITDTKIGNYIFLKQNRLTPIKVKAYDYIGNSAVIKVNSPYYYKIINAIIVLLVLVLIFILLRYYYKNFLKNK